MSREIIEIDISEKSDFSLLRIFSPAATFTARGTFGRNCFIIRNVFANQHFV